MSKSKSKSKQHLYPTQTCSRSVPERLQLSKRLAGAYGGVADDSPSFGMGDRISLAALLARSVERNQVEEVAHYLRCYRAVCDGLGVSRHCLITEQLGLHEKPRSGEIESLRAVVRDALGPPELAEVAPLRRGSLRLTFRRSGIRRLLWLRKHSVELQDPWWNVMEGDIWGRRTVAADDRFVVESAVDFYEALANQHLAGLAKIDAALCKLAELPETRTVQVTELRAQWGVPEAPEEDDDWF